MRIKSIKGAKRRFKPENETVDWGFHDVQRLLIYSFAKSRWSFLRMYTIIGAGMAGPVCFMCLFPA